MKLFERIRRPIFSAENEILFQRVYAENNLVSSRLIQAQICLIFILAGYLDRVLLGDLATFMVFLRYYVFSPVILLIFIFTLTPWFVRYMQITFSIGVCVISCYVTLFTFLNEGIIAMLYFSGVILVVFIGFIYVPMLFNHALVISTFVFSISFLGLLYNESLSIEVIQASILLLLVSIVVALIACYSNERNARLNFHYREMLKSEKDSLQQSNVQLKVLVKKDGLTGIANRRAFDERFEYEWKSALRSQSYLSILIIDVDYFKSFNDLYGHLAGDECLKKIATVLEGSIKRLGDFVARYGGEEFVIILPNTKINQAHDFAQKLCIAIASLKIPHEKSSIEKIVTLSIGISSVIPGDNYCAEREILLLAADLALYQAKSAGRNRVFTFKDSY